MAKVLFIDEAHPLIAEQLTAHGFQCDQTDLGRDQLLPIIGQYTGVILRSRITLDREMLDHATSLRFIGRVGAGMESIDVEYARQKGILCLNSPEGNRQAVGEHAVGMLLALMNHLHTADRQVRQGQWLREENRGAEISGRCVGIIGYGNMGSAFAKCISGFGAEVISWDKYKQGYSDGNTRETNLDEIFSRADILSLHVPLTEETRHMVDGRFLDRFSKPIYLVNTARGAVVDTDALVAALASGRLLGAALDVLEYEESSFEGLKPGASSSLDYLRGSPKVILTPHIAGWSRESKWKLAQVLVDKILESSGLTKKT